MLQIIDHALGRMRSSGHAAVLAEMAIVRLASLEDLDSLADAVERVGTEPVGPTSPAVRPAPAARPTPTAPPAEPVREKKTTDLTGAAPTVGHPEPVAPEPVAAVSHVASAPVEPTTVASASPPATEPPTLPADPLDAWRRAAEAVGGLAVDFAELASRASWRDDVLEIVLPGSAGNAASFLRRPEIAAGLTRSLTELAGRPVRHTLAIDSSSEPLAAAAESEGRAPHAVERGRPAVSQAAMLREVAEHPMVAHVRTLFDAAVRKVEPARPQPAAAIQPAVAAAGAASAGAAASEDDERDFAATQGADGGEDYGGIDG